MHAHRAFLASTIVAIAALSGCGGGSSTSPNPGFKDPRDGQTYDLVKIGTQTWFAENLDYKGTGSDTVGVCSEFLTANCDLYGRLYTWAEAMQGATSSGATPSGVQGVCPSGWHLPSSDELTTLDTYASGLQGAFNLASGLMSNSSAWGAYAGSNSTGFNGLPAGYLLASPFTFANSGGYAWWWSSTLDGSTGEVDNLGIQGLDRSIHLNEDFPANAHSVRCIAN